MPTRKGPKPPRLTFWQFINAPLIVALVTGGILAGVAKLYSDWRSDASELEVRRSAYVELLAEYQNRVSQLTDADARLNRFIGEGPKMIGGKQISENGPDRREWDKLSEEVGRTEHSILRGTGDYVPTTPEFGGVDLLTLAARIERTGGIPDIQIGGLRLIRGLDAEPEALWVFVRAYIPMMTQFGVSRHVLYTRGDLPLSRGEELTPQQEKILGFPDPKSGDLERLQRENDRLHAEIQEKLTQAEKSD